MGVFASITRLWKKIAVFHIWRYAMADWLADVAGSITNFSQFFPHQKHPCILDVNDFFPQKIMHDVKA